MVVEYDIEMICIYFGQNSKIQVLIEERKHESVPIEY